MPFNRVSFLNKIIDEKHIFHLFGLPFIYCLLKYQKNWSELCVYNNQIQTYKNETLFSTWHLVILIIMIIIVRQPMYMFVKVLKVTVCSFLAPLLIIQICKILIINFDIFNLDIVT